jgi:hypothetical protein
MEAFVSGQIDIRQADWTVKISRYEKHKTTTTRN